MESSGPGVSPVPAVPGQQPSPREGAVGTPVRPIPSGRPVEVAGEQDTVNVDVQPPLVSAAPGRVEGAQPGREARNGEGAPEAPRAGREEEPRERRTERGERENRDDRTYRRRDETREERDTRRESRDERDVRKRDSFREERREGEEEQARQVRELQQQRDRERRESETREQRQERELREEAAAPAPAQVEVRVTTPPEAAVSVEAGGETAYQKAISEKVQTYTELGPVLGRDLTTPFAFSAAGIQQAVLHAVNKTANILIPTGFASALSTIGIIGGRIGARLTIGERFGNAARLLVSINNLNKGFLGALHGFLMAPSRFLANRVFHDRSVREVAKYATDEQAAALSRMSDAKKMSLVASGAAAQAFRDSIDIITTEGQINWGRLSDKIEKFAQAGKAGEKIYGQLKEKAKTDRRLAEKLAKFEERLPTLISNRDRWWYYQGVLGLALGSAIPAGGIAFGLSSILQGAGGAVWNGITGLANGFWTEAQKAGQWVGDMFNTHILSNPDVKNFQTDPSEAIQKGVDLNDLQKSPPVKDATDSFNRLVTDPEEWKQKELIPFWDRMSGEMQKFLETFVPKEFWIWKKQ
ncbi:hypothetical protein HYW54_02005 [Candidatus Gottesmanbacteria bacterium]|nr:hypothetical protein [Candidatus Gottesmanbacteria bacterium]